MSAAWVGQVFIDKFVRPTPGPVAVLGSKVFPGRSDRRPLFANAVGFDMQPGEGVDIVHDLEQHVPAEYGNFRHIDCVSILEHVRRPWLAAENITSMMTPGASIFIAVPFAWRFHAYPHDYFRFTHKGIEALFPSITWAAMRYGSTELLDPEDKTPAKKIDGHPYFARSELFAFGRRL